MKKNKILLLFSLLFFIFCSNLYSENIKTSIEYKKVTLNNIEEINKWKNSSELYSFSEINIDLRNLSVSQKKQTFIDILLPAIKIVRLEIENDKKNIDILSQKNNLTLEEKTYTINLFNKYRVKYGDWQALKSRMIIYPTSLILTQGAIESAWGTSRFFREGNNIFGIWSSDPNEPRIAAKGVRDDGFVPHLKKYESIKDSISDLVLILSRNNAYQDLRQYVKENKEPEDIAKGLLKYSEEGITYVDKIINTLEYNNFSKYDSNI